MVSWCCAAAVGENAYCVVHTKHRDLHPKTLNEDEELAPGVCDECGGTGLTECCCHCGDDHEAECRHCDGTGKTETREKAETA
jgi:hypothetical protein